MALTPEYDDLVIVEPEEVTAEVEPSKTWSIDFKNGRIGGFIDEDEALRQYIHKALSTERFRFVIYTDNYGNELPRIIGSGMSKVLLESEIPRMIKDAIMYDDRIDDVEVNVDLQGDKAFVTVTVTKNNSEILTEEVVVDV